MSEKTPYSPKCLVDVIGDAAISGNHDELNSAIGNNQDLRDVVSLHLVLARSAYSEVAIPGKPEAKFRVGTN